MRVLVIANEISADRLVSRHLTRHGFVVDEAASREEAPASVAATRYDCVLLGLALPDGGGSALVRRLRRDGGLVPVIVLAAGATAADRIGLLEAGADDCLAKPFDLDELVARIRVVTRRGRVNEEQPLRLADLSFYPNRRAAIVGGRPLILRRRELALLEALLRSAGQPIHRDQLTSRLYSADEEIGSNSLDVQVHHLRQRLADAGAKVRIATIRGLGYALQAHDD
ncbi:MAG TPA: response regulator transcription factor [Stellaceae bacterium]|nr:response regulator transcription factor [Stellaceae bacterium]